MPATDKEPTAQLHPEARTLRQAVLRSSGPGGSFRRATRPLWPDKGVSSCGDPRIDPPPPVANAARHQDRIEGSPLCLSLQAAT